MQKIIQHLAAGYIILLMMVKILAMPLICLEYSLDKDFITANFCENKNRPAMHCNGKCHLEKQLAKAGDAGTAQSQKGISHTVATDFCEEINMLSNPAAITVSRFFKLLHIANYPSGYAGNIFHPPVSLL